MSKRWLLFVAVVLLAGAALALWLSRGRNARLATMPLRIASLGADLIQLDAAAITRRGPSGVVALRLTEPVELVPYHYQEAGLPAPAPISAWAEHLHVPAAFNAGQFDENLKHLGWLKGSGQWLASHRKPQWMALLVSGPVEGPGWSGIVDLEQSNPQIVERYRNVVQSMMLVDERARVRVRESDLAACRTVVAQDGRGRILVLVTEGAVTLGDLARWIPTTGLDIVRAMNLDGGIEAQLAIQTPELELAIYGQYGTGSTVFDAGPGVVRYPLPAIVAIRPVQEQQAR